MEQKAAHTPGLLRLIAEALDHQMAVIRFCSQSGAYAARGERDMAFWCLDMAARYRRHYAVTRAAIAARRADLVKSGNYTAPPRRHRQGRRRCSMSATPEAVATRQPEQL